MQAYPSRQVGSGSRGQEPPPFGSSVSAEYVGKGGKLLIKIKFMGEDARVRRRGTSVTYKTLPVDLSRTVQELLELVQTKYECPDTVKCKYRLYLPPSAELEHGLWLDPSQPLSNYGFSLEKRTVEIRNQLTSLRVSDLEGGLCKTVMASRLSTVADLVQSITQRFCILNTEEYSLQVIRGKRVTSGAPGMWLEEDKTLDYQKMACEDIQLVVLRKKFFLTDAFLQPTDHYSVHFLYLEARQSVISGFHKISLDDALAYAALQMQITFGDYDPLVHVAGFLHIEDFLAPEHRDISFIEEDVYKHHRKLKELNLMEVDAKFRYCQKFMRCPTFGLTWIRVKEKLKKSSAFDHDILLGVNCEGLLCLHPDTKSILATFDLETIHDFQLTKDLRISWQHGDRAGKEDLAGQQLPQHQYLCESPDEAKSFQDMFTGYVRLREQARKNGWTTRYLKGGRPDSLSVAGLRLEQTQKSTYRKSMLSQSLAPRRALLGSGSMDDAEPDGTDQASCAAGMAQSLAASSILGGGLNRGPVRQQMLRQSPTQPLRRLAAQAPPSMTLEAEDDDDSASSSSDDDDEDGPDSVKLSGGSPSEGLAN